MCLTRLGRLEEAKAGKCVYIVDIVVVVYKYGTNRSPYIQIQSCMYI